MFDKCVATYGGGDGHGNLALREEHAFTIMTGDSLEVCSIRMTLLCTGIQVEYLQLTLHA